MTPSKTDTDIFTAVRSYLLTILPSGVEVVRGQVNRVPQPTSPNHVVMWPVSSRRLATNDSISTPTQRTESTDTERTIQIDVHGPQASENAHTIAILFRSSHSIDAMASSGIYPLFSSDPRQIPYLTEAKQTEIRWSIDLVLEYKPSITFNQESANALSIDLVEVDGKYPPT